jgi:NAD-dependent histone deacetylase SIR2
VVKGKDLFDSVLFSDATSTSLFYTFVANLRCEVLAVSDTTAVHKFIRTLADAGRLLRCYTQNIDGLEEREGLAVNLSHGKGKRKRRQTLLEEGVVDTMPQEKGCQVVQLHGDLKSLRCTNCHMLTSYTESTTSTLQSGIAPNCPACELASAIRQASGKRATKVGTLRPNVVLYGEEHPDADMVGSLTEADIKAVPDMMIILGTSLKVHGLRRIVKEFAKAVHAKGGKVVFINNTPPSEAVWNHVIDHHVAMDCDAWVTDLRQRRSGIWERQTKLLSLGKVLKIAPSSSSIGSKENNFQFDGKKRKILEPKTPRRKALGSKNPNQHGQTRYISPPLSVPAAKPRGKRIIKVSEVVEGHVLRDESQRSPTKRRKTSHNLPVTPPLSPQVRGGRMIAIEVLSVNPPKRKKGKGVEVYRDLEQESEKSEKRRSIRQRRKSVA